MGIAFDPEVLAGINAAMIVSGKKFSANDILDFEHAALAVPYFVMYCFVMASWHIRYETSRWNLTKNIKP